MRYAIGQAADGRQPFPEKSMPLVNFDRANVRFQIFETLLLSEGASNPARAMEQAISLAEQVLAPAPAQPPNSDSKARSSKPRRDR